MKMLAWLNRYGQGLAALVSAIAVVAALIGVFWQVRSSEDAQRAQSARDIYREFVALTVNRPDLAVMEWSDSLPADRKAAYEAYVEYLLYTAEQVIGMDADWAEPMRKWLADHGPYLCTISDTTNYTPEVQALIGTTRTDACPGALSSG
jgi:hypothetical protein